MTKDEAMLHRAQEEAVKYANETVGTLKHVPLEGVRDLRHSNKRINLLWQSLVDEWIYENLIK